jgi:hypothetical protein
VAGSFAHDGERSGGGELIGQMSNSQLLKELQNLVKKIHNLAKRMSESVIDSGCVFGNKYRGSRIYFYF